MAGNPPVAKVHDLTHRYGGTTAVDHATLEIPAGKMVGFIGPDGAGKSTLLGLIAGARKVQQGSIKVLGGSMRSAKHRERICPRIAYMPQGLGKNLYPTLSVFENIDFFARLFGQSRAERESRIQELLASTGLTDFRNRPAAKLSGGMKQKLALCCALIHDPDLLILDEPTTGVDPLSRRQFWDLIDRIRNRRQGMSIVLATAYMEEAEQFDWLFMMHTGHIMASGTSQQIKEQTEQTTIDAAFIALLPEEERHGHHAFSIPPRKPDSEIVIEVRDLTRRFGDFTAVDHVTLTVERGEIFGFLGSNGCGKTTTMKMLTGLLPATEGQAFLFGRPVSRDIETRRNVGYMSQTFSLYTELSVQQNLELHARLFHVPSNEIEARVEEMAKRFGLVTVLDQLPGTLPLGIRQRLSLAVAVIHKPLMLILDEPTSGVDPVARDSFWELMLDLARHDGVTIFISTHFMDEGERCDRISLMHAGKILATGAPTDLIASSGQPSLEETFIAHLREVQAYEETKDKKPTEILPSPDVADRHRHQRMTFSLQRLLSYSYREGLELRRDIVRLSLAFAGSILLMIIIGYGINLDVKDLPFAVLDHDQTTISRDYVLSLAGSPYFIEKPAVTNYQQMDRRLRDGKLSFALELPPHFGKDLLRGDKPKIGVWVDGAMPQRAETILGYLQGMHAAYLADLAVHRIGITPAGLFRVETRYRYNPDVASLVAMVPAIMPLLLIFIPSMLTALGVVREKELGSILNLYTTPVTKLEFLLGKQLPYIIIGMINFLLLTLMALFLFRIPMKGSFWALTGGAFLYVTAATGLGLLASTLMKSQVAAIIATALGTLLPAVQFAGLLNPISSLSGFGILIGRIYPTTYFLTIARGTFEKGLGFADLYTAFFAIFAAIPVLTIGSLLLLKKQSL